MFSFEYYKRKYKAMKKYKIFCGDKELGETDDINVDLTDKLSTKESPKFKGLSEWSFKLDTSNQSINDFSRYMLLKEVIQLTNRFNKLKRKK